MIDVKASGLAVQEVRLRQSSLDLDYTVVLMSIVFNLRDRGRARRKGFKKKAIV